MNDFADAVAKSAVDVAADLCKDFFKKLATFGQKETAKAAVDFSLGFGKYLERNYRRISKYKTILNQSTPVSLENSYESPNIQIEDDIVNENKFTAMLREIKFVVITGAGGSGKSIFLKHMFIKYYREALDEIPLFIELWNLKSNVSLLSYMRSQLADISSHFNEALFMYSMESGRYLILLDGFDEIDIEHRRQVAEEILDIAYKYGDNQILISSRPDDIFDSWNEFYVAIIEPFSKKQVLSLIRQLKYDKKLKAEFTTLV